MKSEELMIKSAPYRHAGVSHPGHVRTCNEDAYLALPALGLWVVADGMGGYAAGDIASQLLVNTLAKAMQNTETKEWSHTVQTLQNAINATNQALLHEITLRSSSDLMGCTMVAVLCRDQRCACFWVGDARLYLYRGGRLYQITRDHSLVQEWINSGMLSEEEAREHPQRHVVTRAIGVEDQLDIDTVQFDLQHNDVLLLCSDGVYNELPDERLTTLLKSSSIQQKTLVQALVEGVIHAVLNTSAKDNATLVAVEFFQNE